MTEPQPHPGTEGGRDALLILSRAAAEMARLQDQVPAIAVRTAVQLGYDGASFRVLEDDQLTHRPLETAGSLEHHDDLHLVSARMADLVLQRGDTVMANTVPAAGEAPLPSTDGAAAAAIASPIWVDGWVAAILVAVIEGGARPTPDQVASFDLLATRVGLTLDNAQRLEERRDTVGRLEQGDRLKGEFLTTISHEMRTPLTVLMGNGVTLEENWDALDEESRLELVSGMNMNVRTLDAMLTNLLDYARMEAGELWVSFEPFDISGVLGAVCERMGGSLGDRRIVTEIEQGLLVSGDVVLIRRILTHFLANAAIHTPPGTTVTASCHRRDGEVVVEVADDGPGIAPQDLPFVGERFYRGGNVNTRPKGLGLGLALALGILDLHGSTLHAGNGVAGGARFSFSLPYVPDPARDAGSPDDRPTPTQYARHHGRA
ncbi:MAG: sensor histidine kinase [Actinomycetota bacterium]